MERSQRRDRITLRFMAVPTDAGIGGERVLAGRVLEWIDKAGYACAAGWSGHYCVTAYVGNVEFKRPILVGALVETQARVVHTGRTSMHVLVTVQSGDPRTPDDLTLAMHCLLIFVAMSPERTPVEVPRWAPRTPDDERLSDGVVERIRARTHIHDLTAQQSFTDASTTPKLTFRFLANPTDVNWGGNAHGGIVMRWIGEVAQALAIRYAGADAVCVYSGGINFVRPVHIGDVVEITAQLIHTGERSMHMSVHVRSAPPTETEMHLTTHCMTIYVVVGEDGRATPIRPLVLASDEDRRLDAHERKLVELRRALPPLLLP